MNNKILIILVGFIMLCILAAVEMYIIDKLVKKYSIYDITYLMLVPTLAIGVSIINWFLKKWGG
jgi:uncharacterized membrane protein YwzB